MEYLFEKNNLNGELTWHKLDAQELEIVNAFNSWDNPGRFQNLFTDIHGRSICLKSPTRGNYNQEHLGAFNALQIYGICGSTSRIQSGIVDVGNITDIGIVNEANHNLTLEPILQQRAFDNTGKLRTWVREYAPLHGMDQIEAEARKQHTQELKYLQRQLATKIQTPFVVPSFVAEGILWDRIDIYGRPLSFQVYRVPNKKRLPNQLFRIQQEFGMKGSFSYFEASHALLGQSLSIIQQNGKALMDCHWGNTSFIPIPNEASGVLYITDLGGCVTLQDNPHNYHYCAFDIAHIAHSSKELLGYLFPYNLPLREEFLFETNQRMFTIFLENYLWQYSQPAGALAEIAAATFTNIDNLDYLIDMYTIFLNELNFLGKR